MSSSNNPLAATMADAPLLTLKSSSQKKELVTVSNESTVEHVLSLLESHNISSVPVVDEYGHGIGLVDMLDILEYMISSMKNTGIDVKGDAFISTVLDTPVSTVSGFSRRDSYTFISEASTVLEAASMMSTGLIHRCAIGRTTGEDKQVPVHICAQSDIIRFLSDELSSAESDVTEMAKVSIGELVGRFGKPKDCLLVVANDTSSMLECCDMIVEKSVSVLAIVDPATGRLNGSFSSSDLKTWRTDDFQYFTQPALAYLKHKDSRHRLPVTCKPTDTLAHVIGTLASVKLHSIWLVNELYQPLTVVTLTDILRMVINYS